VLVDCLQPLNSGPQAFNDMRLALTQLMQSFHYGQRTLFRRLFSPVIDKLLFAATKADHVRRSARQYGVAAAAADSGCLAKRRVRRDQHGLSGAGIGSGDQSGLIDVNGEKIPRCAVIG
jgi:predicted YcjX-like family ATPase